MTEFIPYPVINSDLTRRAWFTEPDVLRIMLAEYGKMVMAKFRAIFGLTQGSGLRTEEPGDKNLFNTPQVAPQTSVGRRLV